MMGIPDPIGISPLRKTVLVILNESYITKSSPF